jgi:hypothetical protein
MGYKKRDKTDGPGAEEVQLAINRHIQDAIYEAEKVRFL